MGCYPVKLQKQNADSEEWEDVGMVYASCVNKARQTEYFAAGATQSKLRLQFKVPYASVLEELRYNTQLYRLVYREHTFNIVDFDDYKERGRNISIVGESY